MVLGSGLVIGCDALSKLLTESYPVEQVLGLRQLIATVPLVIFALFSGGIRCLKPINVTGQLIRGILFCIATWLVILSLKHLPLPTVNSIGFSAPIVVAALSMASLKEQVGLALDRYHNGFHWRIIDHTPRQRFLYVGSITAGVPCSM